jgi:hypothetical protein
VRASTRAVTPALQQPQPQQRQHDENSETEEAPSQRREHGVELPALEK